jgi:cation:H+ antiporter
VLFLAFADIAYQGGSIYHAMLDRNVFLMALAIVMT